MTPEDERKAELTLVLMLHKAQGRALKRQMCKQLGISWGEYQHLAQKYSRILARYDAQGNGGEDVLPT